MSGYRDEQDAPVASRRQATATQSHIRLLVRGILGTALHVGIRPQGYHLYTCRSTNEDLARHQAAFPAVSQHLSHAGFDRYCTARRAAGTKILQSGAELARVQSAR